MLAACSGETGPIWSAMGDHDTAEGIYREILAAYRRVFGAEHPYTLGAGHNVALALAGQGLVRKVLKEFDKVLEAQQRVLGEDHPRPPAPRA